VIAAATATAALLAVAVAPRVAHGQSGGPAFGESTWVAPGIDSLNGDPTAPGPRVADHDHEPTVETILRTPFRVAFFPLKLVARGSEKLVGWIGPKIIAPRRIPPTRKTGTIIRPSLSYSKTAGLGGGFGLVHRFTPDTRFTISGTWWSTNDQRKARALQSFKRPDGRFGLDLEGRYDFRPTARFYGLGNDSKEEDRSIYLDEMGRLEARLHLGPPTHRLRLIATYLEESGRRGYNASPGVEDVLDSTVVDALIGHARVFGVGIGTDLGMVDDVRDPTRGLHGHAEVRQFKSIGGGGLEYRQWLLDARGYLPVFSPRRVIALRAVHQNVDPIHGSAPLPITLYPDPAADLRFAAYAPHRFRDRHLLLGQVEYRWAIWRKLWALGLAELGEVASDAKSIRIADVHESYGFGLRYSLSQETTGRLEIAKGAEGVIIYLNFKGDW
jgi:hypothetical protein